MLDKYTELRAGESDPIELEKKWRVALRDQKRAFKEAEAEGREGEVIDIGRMARFNKINEQGPWAKDWHLENTRLGGYIYDIPHPLTKKACRKPPKGYRYRWASMQKLLAEDRIVFGADHTETAQLRRYLTDSKDAIRSVITIPGRNGADRLNYLLTEGAAAFPHPKPVELMELLIAASGDLDCLVLDPFAGSGTTGDAVMRLNVQDGGIRRFILIEEGEPNDRYARTVTVPRLRSAIARDQLNGSFTFLQAGAQLDREAILQLERHAIADLVLQTDVTGYGRGIEKLRRPAKYVIGHNARMEAIALYWNGPDDSVVTLPVLTEVFEEVKELGLAKPIRVYGATSPVGETATYHFRQIPDEILAQLQLYEGLEEVENGESGS